MKIILLRNIKYDFDSALILNSAGDHGMGDEYVKISEPLEAEFKMIEVDLTAAKVAVIDEDIQKAKAGIELLEQAKAELLAIPDMGETK